MVSDGAGGAFIAWRDRRNSATNGQDIYLQRLIAGLTVAPGWPANGVRVAGPASQGAQQLIADGTGGAIVVWVDNRGGSNTHNDIYIQRITAEGTIAAGWPVDGLPLCMAVGDQLNPALASDGAGGAIVAWDDGRNATEAAPYEDLYASRVLADGTIAPGWAPNGNPVSAGPNAEGLPAVLEDGFGGAIIAWAVGPQAAGAIRAQRLTGAGAVAPGWPLGGVTLAAGPRSQYIDNQSIVSDGAGGAIVAWLDNRNVPFDSFELDVFAQRVRADGTLAPGWPVNGRALCQAPDTQWDMDLVADGTGGAVAVWSDYRANVADVYGQRVTADGAIAPGWLPDGNPLAVGPGHQFTPRAAFDGLGSVTLAFEDLGTGVSYDLYAQRVLLDGSFPPGWSLTPRPLCVGNRADYQPTVASDGTGGLIVVALHDSPTDFDLYASWVPGGVVATVIALVSAEATPERVVLTWHGAESAGASARVERRSESGDWAQMALIQADGLGMFHYEDRSVRPGERYGYRLVYRDEGREAMTAEEWVTIPTPRFALAGARPNPVAEDLVVEFSLPEGAPARLEVFDLAGRQVLTREVGSLGAGTHRVNFGPGRRLPAGVYHLVLIQKGNQAATRAVVVR